MCRLGLRVVICKVLQPHWFSARPITDQNSFKETGGLFIRAWHADTYSFDLIRWQHLLMLCLDDLIFKPGFSCWLTIYLSRSTCCWDFVKSHNIFSSLIINYVAEPVNNLLWSCEVYQKTFYFQSFIMVTSRQSQLINVSKAHWIKLYQLIWFVQVSSYFRWQNSTREFLKIFRNCGNMRYSTEECLNRFAEKHSRPCN